MVQVLTNFLMGCFPIFLLPRCLFFLLNTSPLLAVCITKVLHSVASSSPLPGLFYWQFCFIPNKEILKLKLIKQTESQFEYIRVKSCSSHLLSLTCLHHFWWRVLLDAQIKSAFVLFNVQVLTNKKTTFFGGSSLSMTDYLIWPWFEWLEALELNE